MFKQEHGVRWRLGLGCGFDVAIAAGSHHPFLLCLVLACTSLQAALQRCCCGPQSKRVALWGQRCVACSVLCQGLLGTLARRVPRLWMGVASRRSRAFVGCTCRNLPPCNKASTQTTQGVAGSYAPPFRCNMDWLMAGMIALLPVAAVLGLLLCAGGASPRHAAAPLSFQHCCQAGRARPRCLEEAGAP